MSSNGMSKIKDSHHIPMFASENGVELESKQAFFTAPFAVEALKQYRDDFNKKEITREDVTSDDSLVVTFSQEGKGELTPNFWIKTGLEPIIVYKPEDDKIIERFSQVCFFFPYSDEEPDGKCRAKLAKWEWNEERSIWILKPPTFPTALRKKFDLYMLIRSSVSAVWVKSEGKNVVPSRVDFLELGFFSYIHPSMPQSKMKRLFPEAPLSDLLKVFSDEEALKFYEKKVQDLKNKKNENSSKEDMEHYKRILKHIEEEMTSLSLKSKREGSKNLKIKTPSERKIRSNSPSGKKSEFKPLDSPPSSPELKNSFKNMGDVSPLDISPISPNGNKNGSNENNEEKKNFTITMYLSCSEASAILFRQDGIIEGNSKFKPSNNKKKSKDINWKFTQSFGDDNSSDDDLVTAMQFDPNGKFLAVGDKAGRICVFEGYPPQPSSKHQFIDYKFYTEFQSHEPEFDCLKSQEIEEKINSIEWLNHSCSGSMMLSANDRTIKLWKLHEKKIYEENSPSSQSSEIVIPPHRSFQRMKTASRKRVFGNAHQYPINSVSVNADGETFISADDLRVYLWNIENNMECFKIIDARPEDLQNLTEVITTSTFHPISCNIFLYGSSRGSIRLVDLRQKALCGYHFKQFDNEVSTANNNFLNEITTSLSDAKFTVDGRYVISRDYLTMKIWDVHMENRPVAVINVHDYLNLYLPELYDNDCIFDKFEVHANSQATRFITGSYNNHFLIFDSLTSEEVTMEARDDPRENNSIITEFNVDLMDFAKKALHVCWHPQDSVLAVAGMNKIYIYQAARSRYL